MSGTSAARQTEKGERRGVRHRMLLDVFLPLLVLALFVTVMSWLVYDVRRRGRPWMRWVVFVSWLWPFAVIVWLIRRRRFPVGPPLGWREVRRTFGYAALVMFAFYGGALLTTIYLFQVARVEGQAMSPTLENQDRTIVNKAIYHMVDPAVGDVVMLRYP
jgi:hypothetical protein